MGRIPFRKNQKPNTNFIKRLSQVRSTSQSYSHEGGFGQYLIHKGLISERQLAEGLEEQKITGAKLGEIFVDRKYLTSREMLQELSLYLGIPLLDLTKVEVDLQAVTLLKEETAQRYGAFPFKIEGDTLEVAMMDPGSQRKIANIQILTGYNIQPYLAEGEEIRRAIKKYLTVERSIAELTNEQEKLSKTTLIEEVESFEDGKDAPTIELVNYLLEDAIRLGASDIHWEPGEKSFRVRYRLDGKLETKRTFPLQMARSLIARVKIMAEMDVSERRLPQDGRCSFLFQEKQIDLRVASLPTIYGEKIVVRILDSHEMVRSLQALGMSLEVETEIRQLLKEPHGIILVVGPTGSGKTTTLYSLLQELVSEERNLVSIEEPVEYQLPGVVSVQVQPKIGLTFAEGLRSILRQDPDVIMVGEIRDEETVKIAIAAALTGHLVLSTLHTNTAAEAFTRLMDMGIEPYLVAAVVRGVLSQRLVRCLCEHCKTPWEPDELSREAMGLPKSIEKIYKPQGCSRCRGTGYSGRIGIHELLIYHEDIKELVLQRESSQKIAAKAILRGMIPLHLDGYRKVQAGITSLEEVWFNTGSLIRVEGV
ncbi:MAG: Flp pilus assembly complex ATPase component TadA [Desulfitobacterium sp.]|nr:Flp pilus assembly complex ATPase component TadA [Desulfitobacterium sp.]